MILADDDLATVVAAVEEGRGIFDNIRRLSSTYFQHSTSDVSRSGLEIFLGTYHSR